jgi:hypothetical protein
VAKFREAFSGDHILTSLMAHKLQEFLNLQQGTDNIYEYNKRLNHLS